MQPQIRSLDYDYTKTVTQLRNIAREKAVSTASADAQG